MEDLQEEQRKIEEIAKLLCWHKKSEKGETSIWQKRMDVDSFRSTQEDSEATLRKSIDADDVWVSVCGKISGSLYTYSFVISDMVDNYHVKLPSKDVGARYNKMEACIKPSKGNGDDEDLKPFLERLYVVPPTISNRIVSEVSIEANLEDNKKWKKHVSAYKKINILIDT
uniref:Methyltransferase n=1 Tax=Solanum lycopersicum TaxID=4081 RepID=A0A3Q7FJH3_SOLLC